MNRDEANRRIHEMVRPGECWEHKRNVMQPNVCYRCGGIPLRPVNYFSPALPDNLRVAMVTAAGKHFSWAVLNTALHEANPTTWTAALPAPAIAETIYTLLEDQEGE